MMNDDLTFHWNRWKLAAMLVSLLMWAGIIFGVKAVAADHLMCRLWEPDKTITVWAWPKMNPAQNNGIAYSDVESAVERWNAASRASIGRDLFKLVSGRWQDADVLVHAGSRVDRTWVHTDCAGGFNQRGHNRAVVFVGKQDAHRNAKILAHELGHAAGFADHILASDNAANYIKAKKGGSYRGIMQNYSISPSFNLRRFSDDYAMIARWFD